jgi:hypothetical protein
MAFSGVNTLWLLFLSTSLYAKNGPIIAPQTLPFTFNGGLDMSP